MAFKTILRLMVLTLCSLMSSMVYAVEVNFSAHLIQNPPCDVSGPDGVDQPIKVPFGEIGITKINGVNYQKDFVLTLNCGSGLGNSVAVYLEYRGMPSLFDNNALATSESGLGIRLYQTGNVMPPNTGIALKMSSNGSLDIPFYAIPVKDTDPSVILLETDFMATASVELNYP